jgi:hypothetical protein
MRKKEVRSQGWASNAKQPFKTVELHKVVEILDGSILVEYKLKYVTVVWHMHHIILHPDECPSPSLPTSCPILSMMPSCCFAESLLVKECPG